MNVVVHIESKTLRKNASDVLQEWSARRSGDGFCQTHAAQDVGRQTQLQV